MYRQRSSTALGGALFALAVVPGSVLSQHVVEGLVVASSDGMPLEDVTIRVLGENLTIGTDSAGFFRFELPDDRPGVALDVEVIGYESFNRTWILPLQEPVRIVLRQEAVELEGIEVEVDGARMSLPEMLEFRARSIQNGIPRKATAADLRAFEHQEAEVWDFLPSMNVATGTGCPECMMASGRIPQPKFVVDDREVSFEEFRSYRVGEICRVDIVTIQIPFGSPEKGLVMAYTCSFLRQVAAGERRLPIMLPNIWGEAE